MARDFDELLQGYTKFQEMYAQDDTSLYDRLTREGQSPQALVIACSDSRVDPALILNCEPGDLFVVRNVANLIPPYEMDQSYHGTSAALEFAVCDLQIKHIIVLGHSDCGGIRSLFEPNPTQDSNRGFIRKWMELAESARLKTIEHASHKSLNDKINFCCQDSLRNSLANLKTFPWIQDRINNGELFIHAWFFDLHTRKIMNFNPEGNRFEDLIIP